MKIKTVIFSLFAAAAFVVSGGVATASEHWLAEKDLICGYHGFASNMLVCKLKGIPSCVFVIDNIGRKVEFGDCVWGNDDIPDVIKE